MFRGKVSSYRIHTFEDAVIFVYDIEKCLKQMDTEETELIARIALQEYTQAEAAELTGQSLRSGSPKIWRGGRWLNKNIFREESAWRWGRYMVERAWLSKYCGELR